MTPKWLIDRRTVLKGIGASVALPFLDVMQTSAAAGEKNGTAFPPARLLTLFMPNGVYPKAWDVKGRGRDYQISPSLKSLEKLRREITLISGLTNAVPRRTHVTMTRSFLAGQENGISLDQIVAREIGQNTKYPYMVLGTEAPRGGPPFAGCSVSRSAQNSLIIPELNPQIVFDRLFKQDSRQKAAEHKSIVDMILADSKDLSKKVSQHDRVKLEQYMHSLRAVEKRLERSINPQKIDAWKAVPKADIMVRPPVEIPANREKHMEIMMDLLLLALWTDSTRVATLMMGGGFSRASFPFLDDVSEDHHSMSHHGGKAKKIQEYIKVSSWHVEKLSYLLNRMKAVDEGNGSLLDNSLVFFGSAMKDGMYHDNADIPVIIAGKAAGKFKPGVHHVEKAGTKHSSLLLSLAHMMGVPIESIAGNARALSL